MTTRVRRLASLAALALSCLAAACGGDADNGATDADHYKNLLPIDTARVRVASSADTTTLTVELAETFDQRRLGLMERTALADSAGMLFLFPETQADTTGFWMHRTRIPLDIVAATAPLSFYLGADLIILAGIVYDWRSRGRVHNVWLWGGGLLIASQVLRVAIMGTAPWLAFAHAMARLA